MKRHLLCGLSIAACVVIATPGFAQFNIDDQQSTYKYSNSGYQPITPIGLGEKPTGIQDEFPSPSDRAVPSPLPAVEGQAADGVYTPVVNDTIDSGTHKNRNWHAGIRGLLFTRGYEDDVSLGSAPGLTVTSTSRDAGIMPGFETFFGARNCSGWGWQAGYWGLYPDNLQMTVANPGFTALGGLTDLFDPVTGQTVRSIFNNADSWQVSRRNEFHNVEFNVLRNGGSLQGLCCKTVQIEWLAGFRWLRFDEDFGYSTFTTAAGFPAEYHYQLDTRNDLYGFQLGCRSERCLWRCVTLAVGTKMGFYGNNMRTRQCLNDGNGNCAEIAVGPFAGTIYNFESSKTDFSMICELDLGLNYQFARCWRATVGYRLFGIGGVALAPGQIPYSFVDVADINRVKSNDGLVLHGGYFGIERAF